MVKSIQLQDATYEDLDVYRKEKGWTFDFAVSKLLAGVKSDE